MSFIKCVCCVTTLVSSAVIKFIDFFNFSMSFSIFLAISISAVGS